MAPVFSGYSRLGTGVKESSAPLGSVDTATKGILTGEEELPSVCTHMAGTGREICCSRCSPAKNLQGGAGCFKDSGV
jgi:hypothetical protein